MPVLPQKKGEAQLCISLFALDGLDPAARSRLATVLDASKVVRPSKEPGDVAVAFSCDLLQAAVLVDALRSEDRRQGDKPTKAWLRRSGRWERVADDQLLTSVVGGKPVLSAWVLGSAVAEPLQVGKVRLGGG